MLHLPEDPGATDAASPDHHAIHACLVETATAVFGCHHVAIANDRDRHAGILLHGADECPVGLTGVHLRPGAAMDGEGRDAAILQLLRQLDDNPMIGIPT